jgi:hypothetical protein
MFSKKMILLLALFASLCVFTLVHTACASGHIEPCHIETRDGYYAKEDAFYPGESVYVNGSGFPHSVWVDIYVVNDTTWRYGMDIPSDGIVTTVLTLSKGEIPQTMVWKAPLTPGKYDIIVDVNRDGEYNDGDCLLDNHINVTAGFLVIPEYIIGTALGTAGCFAAFGAYRLFKTKNKSNLSR